MPNDLVKELREWANSDLSHPNYERLRADFRAAADRLEELETRNERLKEACDIFEKNSASCAEEFEGRLKAEADAQAAWENERRAIDLMDTAIEDARKAEAERDKLAKRVALFERLCARALPYLAEHVAEHLDEGPTDRLVHDAIQDALTPAEGDDDAEA